MAPSRLRLYCFAYAGGSGTAFLDWRTALDPRVELRAIQLAGRGARFRDPLSTDFPALVAELGAALHREQDREGACPFVFFGHSLGGLLAFEVARHLQAQGWAVPAQLFISGCQAPRYRRPSRGLSRLDDRALIDELKKYKGTPAEILEHAELMQLLLPVIRADFSLVDDYRYLPAALLDVPMTILCGREDDYDGPEQVDGWAEETRADCSVEWFDGGHFFIDAQREAVVSRVNRDLVEVLARLPAPGRA